MALIPRRYAHIGPIDEMIRRFVTTDLSHVSINSIMPRVVVAVDVEDSIPGLITTLDHFMLGLGLGPTDQSIGLSFIGDQRFVGAGGNYDPSTGTRAVLLLMTGAGGGGGAAQSGGAGTASFGAGGGSGTYLWKWINPGALITGGAWTGAVAGGAGGTGGTGTGATGADAVITIHGVQYRAKGGPGGSGMATSSSPATTAFAWLDPNTSGPGDFLASPGGPGARYANGIGVPGSGGSNPFGGGAGAITFPTVGPNAIGFGGGGGGAVAWNTGDRDGGNGSPTLIVVREFG